MDADVGPKAAALLLISGEKGYDAAEAKLDTGLQIYRNWTDRNWTGTKVLCRRKSLAPITSEMTARGKLHANWGLRYKEKEAR